MAEVTRLDAVATTGSKISLPVKIDWAATAEREWARNDEVHELKTDSGLFIPQYTSGERLRSWVKFIGEPAMVLYETPAAFATRWMAFKNNPAQEVCIFHEHPFGQAFFIFREAIPLLAYVQVTFPQNQQGRTTPGSIWAGECRCHDYGGPCPPVE